MRRPIFVAVALGLALAAAGCGGGHRAQGAPGPPPGGTLAGRVVDGPVAGALVTCIPIAPDGAVLGTPLGPVVTDAAGRFEVASDADVPGPLLCTTTGGTDGGVPAPPLALVLPDGLTGGAVLDVHISPFTTIAYNRLQAGGTFTADAIRAASEALAATLGLTGDLWGAAYGGTSPDDLVMTRLLDAFDGALATLTGTGMSVPDAAAALLAAIDGDTADGALDGQAGGDTVLVDGTPLAELAPDLLPPGTEPPPPPPPPPPPNTAPVADAGPDAALTLGETATLDGTGSADPDGDTITYLWSVAARPAGALAEPDDPAAQTPDFTPDQAGVYLLSLVVSDGDLASAPDTVAVTVAGPDNAPPVADAGPDISVIVGTPVTLDGTASSDPDGDPLTWVWTITAAPPGATAILSSPTVPRPGLTPSVVGDFTIALTVGDGALLSAPDTVTVTALPAPNTPPLADPGPDQTVTLGEAATLDGTSSSDADGDPLTYQWQLTGLPAGSAAALMDDRLAVAGLAPDIAGDYTVVLTVHDGRAYSDPVAATVTAVEDTNTAPTADAGPDRGVVVGTPVTLDGTGSTDPEGDALSYLWSLEAAPAGSGSALSDPTAALPAFTPDLPGVFQFALVVDDGALSSIPDAVRVTAADPEPGGDRYTVNGLLPGDWLGYAVAGPGDVNGDGHADLAAGAFPAEASTGQVLVFDGVDGALVYALSGQAQGDAFGRALAGAGDVDGDGLPDLVVGAPGADGAGTNAGRVRVVRGADGLGLLTLDGSAASDGLGAAVAGAGDVNGDGFADVVAGAPAAQGNRGYARVYSGFNGDVLLEVTGDAAGARLGAAVAGVGDVNGDGFADVAVGVPGSSEGAPYAGLVLVLSGADGTPLLRLVGTDAYAGLGAAVSGTGDVDLDGVPDLAVGVPAYSTVAANAGRVDLYAGADGTLLSQWYGAVAQDQFGFAVAGAGDFDFDGVPDLVVGIVGSDTGGQSAGQARVLSGADGRVLATVQGAEFDGLGRSVAGLGDLDGDGYADVAAGAPGSDAGGADAGQVRAVPGGP